MHSGREQKILLLHKVPCACENQKLTLLSYSSSILQTFCHYHEPQTLLSLQKEVNEIMS